MVTWSRGSINVHRAGAICSTWYTRLLHSEIWEVLDVSPPSGSQLQKLIFFSLQSEQSLMSKYPLTGVVCLFVVSREQRFVISFPVLGSISLF